VSDTGPTLETLAGAVDELRGALSEAARVRADQQELMRQLHEENTRLREAVRNRVQDPLVRDLILLADTCMRSARSWAAYDDRVDPADVDGALTGIAEDIGQMLLRHGVESFRPEPGAPFDRHEARAVRTVDNDDPASAGQVVEVLQPGYRLDDRVLRPAEVVVYRAAPPSTGPT
jgi:molecular chaperone GrpE